MDTINLSNIAEGEFVSTTFSVSRDASFDNTVDFYEVNSDGSVIDPVSGNIIAPGEAGYREAALANRVGLALRTENGTTSEFSVELEGGKQYAPLIAIESAIEPLGNNPVIYFTYSEANPDSFDHVGNPSDNVFGFEDLVNGGDADFNDLVIDVSFDGATPEPPVVEPTPEPPVIEPTPVEPVEPPTLEQPPVVEPTPVEPTTQPTIDVLARLSSDGANIIGQETLDTSVENGEFVFSPEATIPGFFGILDVDFRLVAGLGSIAFNVDDMSDISQSFSNGDVGLFQFSVEPDSGIPAFENIILRDPNNSLGLESTDISFEDNLITIDTEGIDFASGGEAALDIVFANQTSPVIEPTPEAPVVESTPEAPVVESTPEAPVIEPTPEAPVVESAPVEPVVESAPEAPVVESTPVEPVVESTPVEPVVESTPEAPVVESTPEVPVVEPTPEVPVVEPTPVEPTTQPTIDGLAFTFVPGQAQSVEPLGTTVENGEFSFDAENAGIDFFSIFDVDFDLSAGIGSIAFDVDELSTTGDEIFDFDDVLLYRFVSRPNSGLPAFESVTLRDPSNSLGLEPINIFFGEDFITVNTSAIDFATGGSAVLDIEFTEL